MLYLISILWLAAITYTVWKRGRQIKNGRDKVQQLNNFFYEQESKKTESQKGQTVKEDGASRNTGNTAKRSSAS